MSFNSPMPNIPMHRPSSAQSLMRVPFSDVNSVDHMVALRKDAQISELVPTVLRACSPTPGNSQPCCETPNDLRKRALENKAAAGFQSPMKDFVNWASPVAQQMNQQMSTPTEPTARSPTTPQTPKMSPYLNQTAFETTPSYKPDPEEDARLMEGCSDARGAGENNAMVLSLKADQQVQQMELELLREMNLRLEAQNADLQAENEKLLMENESSEESRLCGDEQLQALRTSMSAKLKEAAAEVVRSKASATQGGPKYEAKTNK